MASQQESSGTPLDVRDLWRTPQFVFDYLHRIYNFELDLAANADNHKCELYAQYVDETCNSLTIDWSHWGKVGWLNPPYSNVDPFVDKAIEQIAGGFTTVMLIPSFNGTSIWEKIYDNATVCNIIGQLSFLAGADFEKITNKGKPNEKVVMIREGEPVPGNDRASCIVQFGGVPKLPTHIKRDDMK